MTILLPNVKKIKIANDAINLALKSAQNKSRRAGIGWAMLDSEDNLLDHGSIVAGVDIEKPAAVIARFSDSLQQLILTTEPVAKYFAAEALIASVERSNCEQISLAVRLDDDVVDPQWRSWAMQWSGSIRYPRLSGIAEQLSSGMIKIRRQQRPWVTAISAANLGNHSASLAAMVNEFGFTAYLTDLLAQNRAHLVGPGQREILNHLPGVNRINEHIDIHEIADIASVRAALIKCASEYKCNVVLSCDMELLAGLVNEDLVDEIIHHISISESLGQEAANAPYGLNLEGWDLISTSAVGNCIRTRLEKKADEVVSAAQSLLGRGLH